MHTILITCTRIGIAIPKIITSPHKTENAREQRGKELGWIGLGWMGLDWVGLCTHLQWVPEAYARWCIHSVTYRPGDFEMTSQFLP